MGRDVDEARVGGGGVLVTVEAGPSASKDPGYSSYCTCLEFSIIEVIGKGR